MPKPRLILIADDQAILELPEQITPEKAEVLQRTLNETMAKGASFVLNGPVPWDVVDRRKPDIEKRLAAVEAWIAAREEYEAEQEAQAEADARDGYG